MRARFWQVLALAALPIGAAPPLEITRCEPLALLAGQTNHFSLIGSHLEAVSNLWTSFPAKVRLLGAEEDKASFSLILDREVPVGIHALRAQCPGGISSLHLVFVEDLPLCTNQAGLSQAEAPRIPLNCAVEGKYSDGALHYFKFRASHPQEVSIEVVSQRLGKNLDSIVRLLDDRGRELAYCDDDPGIGPDSRLSRMLPRAGEYLIELRDAGYQGGPQSLYHLRLGSFPLVTLAWPLSAQAGSTQEFSFVGAFTNGLSRVKKVLPAHTGAVRLNAKRRGQGGSGYATAWSGSEPETIEREPNNEPAVAQTVRVPSVVVGNIQTGEDRDLFRFEASPGERIAIVSETRTLGAPCDLLLKIRDSEGKVLVESNPTSPLDAAITNTFARAGSYFVSAEELSQQHGPLCSYRLEFLRDPAPFALTVETDKVQAEKGSFSIKVAASRTNRFSGSIQLSVQGIRGRLENSVIPEKKNETTLRMILDSDAPQSALFTIVGEADMPGGKVKAPVRTTPALKQLFPLLLNPPLEWDGLIGLGL